jgi:hypothetical protein
MNYIGRTVRRRGMLRQRIGTNSAHDFGPEHLTVIDASRLLATDYS